MKIDELVIEAVKQRLDPKCWKGKHKEGTKIKGGVRVNNCVPNESIEENDEPCCDACAEHGTTCESDDGVISGDEMLNIFKKMHHEHGYNKQMERWIARHNWSLDTIEPEQLQDMYNDDEDDDPFERTVWLDDAAVTKYERILSAGQLVNPIIMGPNRSVIDGNHRAQAAKNLHVSIPGYVPIKKSLDESKVKPSAKYLKLADALEDYANKHIPKSQPGFGDFMYHAELIRKGHQDVHKQDLNTVQQKYRKTMGDMIKQHLDETIVDNANINEGLTYNDPVSKWIAVFKASTHPKFKGKTAEQREKMARMAQYKAVQNKKTLSESKKRKAKTLIDGMIKSLIKQGRTHDEAVADLKRQVDSRFYEHIDAVAAIINETFDKPYKSKWENSEYGDVDLLTKLPDGTNLSIMFNHEGDDEWQVEFYRDNSQSVTGQGDAQRIFATVINAVQKFVKKHKPALVRFSASEDVEPGQNSQSRARLYGRIVQRYAHAWGYDMYQEDHGDQVTYELTRLEGVTESQEQKISVKDILAYLKKVMGTESHEDWRNNVIDNNEYFVLKNIPLNSLWIDLPMLDKANVEKYKQMDFSKAPPIVIGSDGNIIDGYHRANVAKALGIKSIKSYVGVKGVTENTADGVFEGPKNFPDMKLDNNNIQQELDYYYTGHAPANIGGRKDVGSLKGLDIVTFNNGTNTLMFLVNKDDTAVFYVAYRPFGKGVVIGNVRSNGTVRATEVYAYLVDKFGTLYSDTKQTPQGRKIWDNLAKFYPNLSVTDVGNRLKATNNVNENFADGKHPEDKGDSKRHGIPKHATLAQLDKIAHQGGRKGQLAHWQANMRRGRAKVNENELGSYMPLDIAQLKELLSIVQDLQEDVDNHSFDVKPGTVAYKQIEQEYRALTAIEYVIENNIKAINNSELQPGAIFVYDWEYDDAIGAAQLHVTGTVAELKWLGSYNSSGKQLMQQGLAHAKAMGAKTVNLTSKWGSAEYYRKQGFTPVDDVTDNPITDVGASFKKDIEEAIAPHGDSWNELNLMKLGEKPAALVGPQEFEKLYKPVMRKYNWIWTHVTVPNPDSGPLVVGFERYIIGQPGEQARIARMQHLILQMNSNLKNGIKPDAAYHIEMGRLLGYSDTDIAEFLKKINM